MKKALQLIIVIGIIIAIIIFVTSKLSKSNLDYNIEDVSIYEYVKYMKDGNYGIIDRDGNIVVEAKYKDIQIPNPSKDLFICYEENNEKSIVLNSKNETLFERYDNIKPIKLKNIASTLCYEKNNLIYEKDGKCGLINFSGKELTKNIYSSIENLQSTEGKFVVCKDDKYGVINANGTELVKPNFDKVETDGYYSEKNKYVNSGFIVSDTTDDGYRYGYINYKGKKLLDTKYNEILRIPDQDEIYLIASENGQFGLYKDNKEIIKQEYQSISYTDNGAIIIQKNAQYGIADKDGKIKVEPKYSQIEENGVYLYAQNVKENDVYDSDGNKLDITFSKSAYQTSNDNYRITTFINNYETYYGIENSEGTQLVESSYKYIEYAFGDYFIAENKDEKYGIINANGKIEINFDYDLIQKIKDKNIIQLSNTNDKNVKFYSKELKNILQIQSPKIENKESYVEISDENQEKYFDVDGNEIEENSDIVQNELKTELPEKMNNYKKIQYSLEDVYYM